MKVGIKIVTNRKLQLSDMEFAWYQDLVKEFPYTNDYINQCADFNADGEIEQFRAASGSGMPLAILWFLMVVSINQRLRKLDTLHNALNPQRNP